MGEETDLHPVADPEVVGVTRTGELRPIEVEVEKEEEAVVGV